MSDYFPRQTLGGDLSVGRDIDTGGDASIKGTATIGHDLVVKGTIDAANIKAANKGFFATADELRTAYPYPHDGWWALVGDSIPGEVYRAYDGKWIDTGSTAGYADLSGAVTQEVIRDLSNYFLSKTGADTASGLISFLKGLDIGNYVNSMSAGRGAGIDADGNAQVESIEVRTYMKVMELITNRLTAVESEFTFTDSGTIESVTKISTDTYKLKMRKRWDYDYTAFKENDVVYGSVNTLLFDGSYFTSWFRVNSVDTSANTLIVSLYANLDVPAKKNYAPVAGMVVNRRGNALNEERQSCWYISSFEGTIMYLEGVTKPILDEENYYMFIGKPKHLELFENLPINYDHPYLFARGAIIQDLLRIDYKGVQKYEIIDLGVWQENVQYIRGYSEEYGEYVQHQVWYKSCCWRVAVDKATIGVAPRWNNTEWVCVVGDSNFTLEIDSSRGHFFRLGREYTTLTYKLKHGDMDISADAFQVEWERDSGLPDEDLVWNSEHAESNQSVEITPKDMPSNWAETKQVTFRVTVFLKDGDEDESENGEDSGDGGEVKELTTEINFNK